MNFMNSSIWIRIALTLGAFAPLACGGRVDEEETTALESEAFSKTPPPPLPSPLLEVPAGNRLAMSFHAEGVQIYACTASGATYAWVFQAPEAKLYDRHRHVVMTHYAGPTWEARDGSKVVGAKRAGVTVDPTAIPWLLLEAVSHTGDGRVSEVTFIQRLDTTGGLAPATGCDATTVGALARMDYTATYSFYRAKDEGDCH